MEKYLGNKTVVLPAIEAFLHENVPDARSLSDMFAGTTNVSRHFRRMGMSVITSDLNRFSYVLGRAYLGADRWPRLSGVEGECDEAALERFRFSAEKASKAAGATGGWRALAPLARALTILQRIGSQNRTPGVFHDAFCVEGKHADFISVRGGKGRRNYFSVANALFVDGVLEALRLWFREGRLSESELFLLLASVIEEVVIVANVSGTFHDFSRDRLWPNALQTFTLRLPPSVLSGGSAEILNADALEVASAVGAHDVCYLDPPYNFRQYGAYYHMLNFIAAYPFIESPRDYTHNLSFVRGQNMRDDHTSAFCFRGDFIASLREVIERVPAPHVMLSYYGGRNHWNHWSATDKPTDRGLKELEALFGDKALFDTCRVVPALAVRRNYQSRVGEHRRLVDEYLLMGSRTRVPPARSSRANPLAANVTIGVDRHFGHFASGGPQDIARLSPSDGVAIAVG